VKPNAQARDAVAGSWSFPRPPWPSTVAGLAFEAFPGLAPRRRPKPVVAEALVDFTPLQSARVRRDGLRRPSSRGIRQVVPSCQQANRASTPGSRSPHRSDGSRPSNLVPSSWFLPTSTVSSARRSRVCCTPQPDKGSSRFAYTGARHPEAVRRRARMRDTHSGAPRDAVHTLRSLPFADSRTASPRPLPSMSLPSRRSGPTIRFDEAPIRRSGPPRHRGIGRGGSTPNPLQTRQPRRVAKPGERGLILRTVASSSASRPCSVDEVRCRQSHR
jgi:hypothetical protein